MKVLNSYELQDKGSVMKTIVRTKKEKVTWKEFFQVVMAIAFPIAIQIYWELLQVWSIPL